jgi:hypothetical protein
LAIVLNINPKDPRGRAWSLHRAVEGPRGKCSIAARWQISTKELTDCVIRGIEQPAGTQKAEQEPQYFKGGDADDYVLARW